MEKIKIPYPIIVEGKYDKIKLSSLLDAQIFVTDGFNIFKNAEKRALLLKLSEKSRIIVLTDSDGGGVQIRKHCLSVLPPERVINLYIPEVEGKEKRKKTPSKAGYLGVEGIDAEILRKLFLPFASDAPEVKRGGITKTDLYEAGLSGRPESAEMRKKLCASLGFPAEMSATALLSALNVLYSKNEFLSLIKNP